MAEGDNGGGGETHRVIHVRRRERRTPGCKSIRAYPPTSEPARATSRPPSSSVRTEIDQPKPPSKAPSID